MQPSQYELVSRIGGEKPRGHQLLFAHAIDIDTQSRIAHKLAQHFACRSLVKYPLL